MNPNDFQLNSDFASLKNDTQSNTISVTVNNGTTYGFSSASSTVVGTNNVSVGNTNAGIRARGRSSKSTSYWVPTTAVYEHIDSSHYSDPGTIFPSPFIAILWRTSSGNMRLQVMATGGGGGGGANDLTIRETVTFTFVFSTFLSPFDN